ncbi:SAM-dependent methyltransferase [Planctomycetota bacterium]
MSKMKLLLIILMAVLLAGTVQSCTKYPGGAGGDSQSDGPISSNESLMGSENSYSLASDNPAPNTGIVQNQSEPIEILEPDVIDIPAPQEEELPYIREPDILFVPTPYEVVDKMLEMAQVTKDDLVYDLGCGDGRIVITAAKEYGCQAIGYDIDPERVRESRENVDANNLGDLVKIEQADVFTLDLSEASVITLYLLPSLNVKLIPQLEELKPGSRIVSHDFDMQGVIPDQVVTVETNDSYREHEVYLWTTPLKKE